MDSKPQSIDDLRNRRKLLMEQWHSILNQLKEVNNQIEEWSRENIPTCSCCHSHQPYRHMWIATQEDIDNYIDREGYAGPIEGQYYCGCWLTW